MKKFLIFLFLLFPNFVFAENRTYYERAKVLEKNDLECKILVESGKFSGREFSTIKTKECQKNKNVYIRIIEENKTNFESIVSATIISKSIDFFGILVFGILVILTFLIGGFWFAIFHIFITSLLFLNFFFWDQISNFLKIISFFSIFYIFFINRSKILIKNYLKFFETIFISVFFGTILNLTINFLTFQSVKISISKIFAFFFGSIIISFFTKKNSEFNILEVFDSKKIDVEKWLIASIFSGNLIIFFWTKTDLPFLKGIFSNIDFLSAIESAISLVFVSVVAYIIINTDFMIMFKKKPKKISSQFIKKDLS